MTKMKHLFGVDLGGTKIEGVILNAHNLDIISRIRVPTEAKKGYTHILNQIKLLLKKLIDTSGIFPEKIGFGTPGCLDPYTNLIKNSNTVSLNDKPLKHDLEELFKLPIFIANDANCFALAESHLGVVKNKFPDAHTIFGIIMGTGVGGGIVINGKVLNGIHGIAGEWGHNFLDESGGQCYCGKVGCVETILSGPGLQNYYHSISNKSKPFKDIYFEFQKGSEDKLINKTIDRLNFFFGKAVSTVINIIDPDVIIVGGGIGNVDSLYVQGVEYAKKFVFNNRLETKFTKPMLGDSAGVLGAAMLTSPKNQL